MHLGGSTHHLKVGWERPNRAKHIENCRQVLHSRHWRDFVEKRRCKFGKNLAGNYGITSNRSEDQLACDLLLAHFGRVISVNKNVRIEEIRTGHRGRCAAMYVYLS